MKAHYSLSIQGKLMHRANNDLKDKLKVHNNRRNNWIWNINNSAFSRDTSHRIAKLLGRK